MKRVDCTFLQLAEKYTVWIPQCNWKAALHIHPVLTSNHLCVLWSSYFSFTVKLKVLVSRVWSFTILWTIAFQAPLLMGILQTRILKGVFISFSRGSPWPGEQTCVSSNAGRFFTIWATREVQKSSFFFVEDSTCLIKNPIPNCRDFIINAKFYSNWTSCWLSWYRIHLQCGRPGFHPWVGRIL